MDNNNKIENPKPDQNVCFNCKHLWWLVAIGQGARCGIDKKYIPSRYHSCPKFEFKIK